MSAHRRALITADSAALRRLEWMAADLRSKAEKPVTAPVAADNELKARLDKLEARLAKQTGSDILELQKQLALSMARITGLEEQLAYYQEREKLKEAGITAIKGEDYLEKIGERLLGGIGR